MNAVARIRIMLRGASLLRWIAHILNSWKLLAVIAYFLVPIVPHLRINDLYDRPAYGSCLYLGNRGIIRHSGLNAIGCPWLMLLNPNEEEKFHG